MGVLSSQRGGIVFILLCAACSCICDQDTCSVTRVECGCNDRSEDIRDLQERLICLESAMDQQTSPSDQVIRDCSDVTNNGSAVYRLSPESSNPFDALCVFDSDGKWTVIQQRVSGDVSFLRAWVEYQRGFGVISDTGNIWLGLEKMHQITKQRQYTLRIDLQDWDDSMHYAEYSLFAVGDEASKYVLRLDDYSGTLPEALLERSNNRPFSTFDQDNDAWSSNCASRYAGGWWYLACFWAHLNGPYRNAGDDSRQDDKGIIWVPYKGYSYSMKYSRMRIKPTFDN